MAFDQPTRNRLQRFVNEVRRALEEEFTRQLQSDYGLDPASDAVTPIDNLRHLNDAQRETARILRDTLAHYTASGDMNISQGLDRIVREQAFTVLNRLAALRMAEARGLLVESVGNGFQAKGFQLYARLAGTGLGETGDAYRVYLSSVFDELAQDLPGLFDRYSPQGRLFPREAALLQVLNLINDADIAPLWSEDETIGWIYQYFNSKEERKAMREASQAPRNSRELAVRNQFFTPRYVVEFLVDNTLGRLWFNATGGQTSLRERCQYLLVKPDETQSARPEPVEGRSSTSSDRTAIRLRDPRTLKLLDPACGSMHFGLYAFDLFAEIYREAWAWEQQHGPGSLDVSTQPQAALKPLSQTYEHEAAFLRDVPRLIIEHNLYGVDIDPRAAQIASLALWLRAQRAWHDEDVKAKDRPLIGRGHVVAAIAPPADRELRKQFAANLDLLDADLFEKTLQLLKGLPELGVLLQVERELPHLIRQVYVGKGTGLFADQEQANWQQAEARLRTALTEFTQKAKSTFRGRLFAQDALYGLRLIDLCREVFDVAVMNPPFGEPPQSVAEYIERNTPGGRNDIYAAFVMRLSTMLRPGSGKLGAITSRAFVVGRDLREYRARILQENAPRLTHFLDLGAGVLDGAMVETAAYVIDAAPSDCIFYKDWRNTSLRDKARLKDIESWEYIPFWTFRGTKNNELLFGLSADGINALASDNSFSPSFADATQGLTSEDDERFVRLKWEVAPKTIGSRWQIFSKGGDYSWFTSDLHLVVNREDGGAELAAYAQQNSGNVARTRQSSKYYGLPAAAYSRRSQKGFSCRRLRAGSCFSDKSGVIFPLEKKEDWLLVLPFVLASKNYQQLISAQSKFGSYEVGAIKRLPRPDDDWLAIANVAREIYALIDQLDCGIETSSSFVKCHSRNFSIASAWKEILARIQSVLYTVDSEIDQKLMQFQLQRAKALEQEWHWAPAHISYAFGVSFGRWDIRYAIGKKTPIEMPSSFSPIPHYPPGQLRLEESDPYDFDVPPSGILVDDPEHALDIETQIHAVLLKLWGKDFESNEQVACAALNVKTLREWIQKPSNFFSYHLGRYTKSRRSAPIYWPLSTNSGGFTLWVYYPSLTSQTLYTAINDFVEPKLKQVGADVTTLRNKGSNRTRDDEKQFEALQAFELELIELRDTLLKLAPTYKPNHDDGVQISAAPLWPLFRHKPWQKVLKDTWAKLEKGDYDWAHLGLNYWPGRVREKCKTDKSLAIAHGLENLYIEPEAKPKKARGRKKSEEM